MVSYNDEPLSQWVVETVSVEPAPYVPTLTTSYHYENPIINKDSFGRRSFRGFSRVSVTQPNGVKTESHFAYNPYYAGLLKRTITWTASGKVHQVVDKHHAAFATQGTDVTTYLDLLTETRIADSSCDVSVAACLLQGAFRETSISYRELTFDDGSRAMYLPSSITDTWQEEGQARQKITFYDHYKQLAATKYQVAPARETAYERIGGTDILIGKTEFTYYGQGTSTVEDQTTNANIQLHNAYRTATQVDDTGEMAVHITENSPQSGLILRKIKPQQEADGGTLSTEYTYDTFKIHIIREVNEMGHVLERDTDLGTGLLLELRGPNWRCPDGTDCDFDDDAAVPTRTVMTYDGFGRLLERWTSVDKLGGVPTDYQLILAERNTYGDTPFPLPCEGCTSLVWATSQRKELRISEGFMGEAFSTVLVYRDGLGRTLREQQVIDEGADSIINRIYNDKGELSSIQIPDPQVDGDHESYFYSYDDLSRVIAIRMPKGTSGTATEFPVIMEYDGLVKKITESINSGSGNSPADRMERILTRNTLGQLIRVEERLDDGSYAATEYEYDANGHMRSIINPNGQTTLMSHDFLGRRLGINVSGRQWKYRYDLNGKHDPRDPAPWSSGARSRIHDCHGF